jgi:TonB family protein
MEDVRRLPASLFGPLAVVIACLAVALPAAAAPVAAPAPASAPEPAITTPGVEGDFLRGVHALLHERWAKGFIDSTAARAVAPSPLADRTRAVVVLFAIRWDGTIAEANVGTSSRVPALDKAAVEAVRTAGRFPVPPVDVFSDDGIVHLRWTLALDHRLCSDGKLIRREDSLEETLPRLFVQGRAKEALLRVKRQLDAGATGGGDPMALFARAWLSRLNPDAVADVDAAAVLLRLGDLRQIERLRNGLGWAATAPTATAALRAARVDVCPLVRERLAAGGAGARLLAMNNLREAASPLPESSPCAQALAAAAADARATGAVRAAALQTLGMLSEGSAQRLWPAMIKDSDQLVRAAAVSVSARPGGGRPALYRLIPFLRDSSADVRAAAAAGMVHAAGELALDQLVGVLKDPDPRLAVALSAELARLSSPPSAALLARLAKRDAVEVRVAAVRALATRSDAAARAAVAPILAEARQNPRAPQAIRQLAAPDAPADQSAASAESPDSGLKAFRALLAANKPGEAADVLVAQIDRLPPRAMVSFLAAWLDNPPTPSPRVSTTTPDERPGER